MSTSRQPFFVQILATTDRIFHAECFLGENFSSRPAPTFLQLDHAENHARNSLCKLKTDVKNLHKFNRAQRCTSTKFQALFEVIVRGECLGKVSHYYFNRSIRLEVLPSMYSPLSRTSLLVDKETDPELHHLVTSFQIHKCLGYCLRSRVEKGETHLSKGTSSTSPGRKVL